MDDFETVPVGTIALLKLMENRPLGNPNVFCCDCCNSMWNVTKPESKYHFEGCELKEIVDKL